MTNAGIRSLAPAASLMVTAGREWPSSAMAISG